MQRAGERSEEEFDEGVRHFRPMLGIHADVAVVADPVGGLHRRSAVQADYAFAPRFGCDHAVRGIVVVRLAFQEIALFLRRFFAPGPFLDRDDDDSV